MSHENQVFTSFSDEFHGACDDRWLGERTIFFGPGHMGCRGKRYLKMLGKHGKSHGLLPQIFWCEKRFLINIAIEME
jgi:hypothetical protein